jgi:hypothetical protein
VTTRKKNHHSLSAWWDGRWLCAYKTFIKRTCPSYISATIRLHITLFRSITMFYGTDNILQNILHIQTDITLLWIKIMLCTWAMSMENTLFLSWRGSLTFSPLAKSFWHERDVLILMNQVLIGVMAFVFVIYVYGFLQPPSRNQRLFGKVLVLF